jgi:hypothetical protein
MQARSWRQQQEARDAEMMDANKALRKHAYSLEVSGYTIIPCQLSPRELAELRKVSNTALAAVRKALRKGESVPLTPGSQYYEAASVLYCWGPAAFALLEHPLVLGLADMLLKDYLLNDLSVFSALPAPKDSISIATTGWHRDCHNFNIGGLSGCLWFLFYLDPFTAENGSTWIVPGSHRLLSPLEPELPGPWQAPDLESFPSRKQLIANAGDLVVIDARALHTSDRNRTSQPRRLINLGLVHESVRDRIRIDHWGTVSARIVAQSGKRLGSLFGADLAPHGLRAPDCVLPQGWYKH